MIKHEMNKEQFITTFVTYFAIDKSEVAYLKLNLLANYIEKKQYGYYSAFMVLVEDFMPTSVNPYPMLSHFIDLVKQRNIKQDKENVSEINSDAQEIANTIIRCVHRYDYTRPVDAKKDMGDMTWDICLRFQNSWEAFCSNYWGSDTEIFRAHLRDSAKAFLFKQQKQDSFSAISFDKVVKELN